MRKSLEIFNLLSRKEKIQFLVLTSCRCLVSLLDLMGIVILGMLISNITSTGSSNESSSFQAVGLSYQPGTITLALIALIFFISKSFGSFTLMSSTKKLVAEVDATHTKDIFNSFTKSSLTALDKYSPTEMVHGLTHSTTMAFNYSLFGISTVISELALLSLVAALLAIVNLWLFLFILFYFTITGYLIQRFVKIRNSAASFNFDSSLKRTSQIIHDYVSNFRPISAGHLESSVVNSFKLSRTNYAESNGEFASLAHVPRYFLEIAMVIGALLLLSLNRLFSSAVFPLADLTIFAAGIFRIIASMLPLQNSLLMLQRVNKESELAISMALDFGKDDRQIRITSDESDANEFDSAAPSIQIRGVTFLYPNQIAPVFQNVNLDIHAGELVALIGASGSGKSTFSDLVLGLRPFKTGSIKVNKKDAISFSQSRPGISGYLPQNPLLIEGTILENIMFQFTSVLISTHGLDATLQLCGLSSVIDRLPNGIETRLGSDESRLSGGEVQRIGLARALVHNPKLLVLDEPTSALDHETEEIIRETIRSLRGKVTVLVISHGSNLIRDCDRTLKFGNGQILEMIK